MTSRKCHRMYMVVSPPRKFRYTSATIMTMRQSPDIADVLHQHFECCSSGQEVHVKADDRMSLAGKTENRQTPVSTEASDPPWVFILFFCVRTPSAEFRKDTNQYHLRYRVVWDLIKVINATLADAGQDPVDALPNDLIIYSVKGAFKEQFYIQHEKGQRWRSLKSIRIHLENKLLRKGEKCFCESCKHN